MAYIKVPTWSPEKKWHYTTFEKREDLRDFVKTLFKEPGKYNFDETSYLFNEQARVFQKKKMFCEAPELSRDYIEYWDTEKEKCRKGVIFHNDKGDSWYLPRFYYHWLNFLHIYNKSVENFTFPDVRDVQYHMGLYEILASLHDLNAATLKARQKASSYFHLCKMYNKYLFENGYIGKIGASHKNYMIQPNGSWKFLDHYHNFTNLNTAWACNNSPDKPLEWQQKIETKTSDGRKVKIGTMASIVGITFEKDPTAGVGGPCTEFFYEEGGIAPTADQTYIYMKSALREGGIVSGIFSIAGSVGKLEQAGPLKEFVTNPKGNDFYPVWSNLIDKNGTEGWSALFIPEHWGMPPYIDKYGNSLVEDALNSLTEQYKDWKINKTPELYQLEVSQHPRTIEEAFAIRTVSIFPARYTNPQVKRVEDGEYYLKFVDLYRDDKNIISYKKSERTPNVYPVQKTQEDKRGCIVLHEKPPEKPEWGSYYFSVDPVEVGKSDTSESLACIYIYKNPEEVTTIDAEGNSTTHMEGDKIVAEWTGRYDDVNETNENMSMLIELYNAWGVSENNKTSFNNYMILKNRVKYLATTEDMLFDKELKVAQNIYQKFGYTKTTAIWKKLLEYGVNYLSEDLGHEIKEDGTIIKIKYGIERVPFIWLLREMQAYNDKGNYDRITAYCALIAFAKIQQAANGIKKRTERKEESSKNNQNTHTFIRSVNFKSIGRGNSMGTRNNRNIFKSIR